MDANDKWVDVLIDKENVKGAVCGIYSMNFEKGKSYRIDWPLAQVFFRMGVAAVNPRAHEIPGGPQILHVVNGKAFWAQEKTDTNNE